LGLLVISWRRVLHRLGHLQNHQLTETAYPGMVNGERLDLSDKEEDVKILEDIAPGTRTIAVLLNRDQPFTAVALPPLRIAADANICRMASSV